MPKKTTDPRLEDLKGFASDVMLMKHRAATLGLWKTMHALEPATQAVGYEIAEILDGEHPTKVLPVIVAHPKPPERSADEGKQG